MPKDENPELVSVIIPAYNHENYIRDTIRSIAEQTYTKIEIIITNDGSTDDTKKVIELLIQQYKQRFTRTIFINKANEGIIKSLNLCLSKALGKYIYIIASDDIAAPNAIKQLHHFLSRNEDYVLAVADNILIDENNRRFYWNKDQSTQYKIEKAFAVTFGDYLQKLRPDIDFNGPDFGTYKSLLSGNHIPNGYLIRHSALKAVGGYAEAAPLEDLYMMLQLSKIGKFKFIPSPLFSYRWHDANTTNQRTRMTTFEKQTLKLEIPYARARGMSHFIPQKTSFRFLHIRLYEKKHASGKMTIRLFNISIIKRFTKNNKQILKLFGIEIDQKKLQRTLLLIGLIKKDISILLKYTDYSYIQRIRYYLGFRKKKWDQNGMIYRTSWLDNKKGYKIRESKDKLSIGPTTPGQPEEKKAITLPPIYQYTFSSSVTLNISTSAFLSNNRLFIERVHDVSTLRCDYPTGPSEIRGSQLTALPKKQSIDYQKGIYLGGNGASNYYHWLVEILPKMEFVNELGKEFSEHPLLVNECVKEIPTFQDALNFFSGGRPIIYLDDKKYFTVKNLVAFTTPSNLPFNLIKNETPRVEDFRINASSIHYLRKNILDENTNPAPPNKRIFLTLENPRRPYNEEDVFKVFERAGFKKAYLDKLSFQQQVELMQEAEMIAGPTGAAWTNLIFCKPGVKCICWMDEFAASFSSFSNIAHILNIKLHYIFFKNETKKTSEIYKKNYKLDTKEVKKSLETLLDLE